MVWRHSLNGVARANMIAWLPLDDCALSELGLVSCFVLGKKPVVGVFWLN